MALNTPQTTDQVQDQEENFESTVEAAENTEAEEPQDAPAEPEPETKKETSVATQSQGKVASPVGGNAAESRLAENGMEGLTVGGMSFDSIKLPSEGQFLIGQDDEELGKSFKCVIQQSRARFIVRQSNDQDAEMFYSYDADQFAKTGVITDTEGGDRADEVREWKEDGYDEAPVIKKYLEVMVILIDEDEDGNPGERDRQMAMLSIPPASVQRFSGFIYQNHMMKKLAQHEFVTECIVGKKVKKDSNSFFPWNFKNAGPVPEDLQFA